MALKIFIGLLGLDMCHVPYHDGAMKKNYVSPAAERCLSDRVKLSARLMHIEEQLLDLNSDVNQMAIADGDFHEASAQVHLAWVMFCNARVQMRKALFR